VEEIERFANGAGQAFENVVVLGIGGSALGTIALRTALLDPYWNELDDEGASSSRASTWSTTRTRRPSARCCRIDLRRTLFNVVSKSGGTAETMSQFLIVRERLEAELGDGYRRHLLFTTDPEKGVLRKLAARRGSPRCRSRRTSAAASACSPPWACCPPRWSASHPRAARGRAGDGRALPHRRAAEQPRGLFAALQYLADTEAGAPIHVMMPYSDRLRDVADWFRQLWAESLGKERTAPGEEVFVGPTPVKSLGATDQHSQVQLYMEGPFDKTITFLDRRSAARTSRSPGSTRCRRARLPGRPHARRAAPRGDGGDRGGAHAARPDEHDDRDPRAWTPLPRRALHAAADRHRLRRRLYDVDPLDQPGVELGKQLTYGIMGRPGFESTARSGSGSARAEARGVGQLRGYQLGGAGVPLGTGDFPAG
jgi:glucose-6-phosphate isomerase